MNNTSTCPDSDIKFTCVLPHFVALSMALCPVLLYNYFFIAQSYKTGIALISVRHLSPPTHCIYSALATRHGTCNHHQPTACQTGGKVNLSRELMKKLKTVLGKPEPWIINYVIQSVAIEVPVFPALLRTSAILGHFCTNNVRKSLIARRMMNCWLWNFACMSGTILPTVCQIFGGDPMTQLNLKNVKTIFLTL